MKRVQTVALIALAIGCGWARANPDNPTVVHGSATFSQPNANTLNVTTATNKSVINWQGFSIGTGQTTNFIQPNSNSAVLNRVTGSDPSKIYGNLNSNGKVFLINQHGMMIGAGARINTAGFYGSTLDITNEDFLNGNLKFEGGGFGGIVNKGYIHAGPGGNVVLIAPDIENGGVIEVDDGRILLAAGESIRITSLNDDAIEFDVEARGDNSIINLGDIIAKQGAVRLFADNLEHSGSINANGLVQNTDGTISLVARNDIRVAAGATLNADGDSGGSITVQSHHGDVIFEGSASAQGRSHHGGRIEILGNRVGLFGEASVDASGKTGGGEVLIGGDFQGRGETQTAVQTQVGLQASIHADAIDSGDGGKVIVWADDFTLFQGEATAKGGETSGDGGFIEISGKGNLGYDGKADASAANGAAGTVLFDPVEVTVELAGATVLPANPLTFATSPGQLLSIAPVAITNVTDTGSNVIIQADQDIIINDAIGTNNPSGSGGDIGFEAGRSILINADISTDGGSLFLYANSLGADSTNRQGGQAELTMSAGTTIDTTDGAGNAGNVEFWMDFGVNGTAGNINIADVNAAGGHVLIKHNGNDNGGSILPLPGGGTITASSVFIDHDGPTNGSVGSPDPALNLVTDNLGAHIHEPTLLGIFIDAQPLDTGIVTVGNTCYGNGDPGCDTFGSHFVRGLETINGGGSINLNVSGGNLLVVEPIQIADLTGTGNPGNILINSSGPIIANSDIINFIPGGNIDLTFGNAVTVFNDASIGINGGTVTLDDGGGAGSGPLLLNSGTFLEGVGVIDGDVIVQGGVIDIGDDQGNVGTLTITGNLSLDLESIVVFDIVGSAVHDQLVVNGASGALVFGTLAALWDTLTPPAPTTYPLINAPNGVFGPFDTVLGPVGSTFSTLYPGTSVQLDITDVAPIVFWTGQGGNSQWENPGNWSTGNVPGSQTPEFVDINFDGPLQVTISLNTNPSILGISTQNELSIQGVGQLSVTDPATSLIGDLLNIDSSGGLDFVGDVYLAGLLSWKNGALGGTGAMTVASIAELQMNNPGASVDMQLINSGTIRKIDADTTTLAGGIVNLGTILVSNGTLAYVGAFNEGIIDIAAGATLTTSNADLTSFSSATILGSGTVDVGTGTLFNEGTLEPGGADAVGILTIQGNLTLSSTADLQIEVGNTGLNPGTDYDQLRISGAGAVGTLDGAIFVSPLNGDPVAGSYTLVDTINGATLTNSFGFPSLTAGFTPLVTDSTSVQTSFGGAGVFWDDGGVAGDWFDVLNWSTDTLPLITDDVTIAGTDFVINIAAAAAVANTLSLGSGYTLNINSGSLTIASDSTIAGDVNLAGGAFNNDGNLQLDGNFGWQNGSLGGSGQLTTAGLTTITHAATGAINLNWINDGTINFGSGAVQINNGVLVTNNGIFNADGGTQIQANGGTGIERFVNASGGNLNVNADLAMQPEQFDNAGTITVASGITLSLGVVGSAVAGLQTGTWDFTDATISLVANNWVMGAGFSIASLPGATLNLAGGDLTNSSGGQITLPANLTVNLNNSNSAIQGANTTQIDGDFNWTAGSLLAGGGLVTTGITTLSSAGTLATQADWNNTGTVNHVAGILQIQNGATINNFTIYNANGGTQISANGGTGVEAFVNSGQFNVIADYLVQPEQFDNSGTITVASGVTLSLGAIGSAVAGLQTGTWDFTDATISLVANNWVMGAGFSIASLPGATLNLAGGDLTNSSGGQITLPANLTVNLNNSNSSIQGANTTQIDGAFNWTAGSLLASGGLVTTGITTLSSAGTLATQADWNNTGTVNHVAGILQIQNGATINNFTIYNANGGTQISANGGTGVEAFVNSGQFNVIADYLVQPEQFDNSGTITVASGITLSLGAIGSAVAGLQTGTWDFTDATISLVANNWVMGAGFSIASLPGATLNLAGGDLTNSSGGQITLPANLTVNLNNSNSSIQGANTTQIDGAFNWTAGSLLASGGLVTTGTTTLSSGGTLATQADWTNTGVVNHVAGILQIQNGATINNFTTYNANGGAQISANGGTGVEAFVNSGQFNVIADYLVQPEQFDNSGTITVASGITLSLGAVGSGVAGNQTGTWDFTDATISLVANNWVMGAGFVATALPGATLDLAGGDLTNSSGGLITLPANLTVNLNNSNSAIQGANTTQIDGDFNWTAGTLLGGGGLITLGTTTLNSGGTLGLQTNWNNIGTVNHVAGILQIQNGSTLTNNNIYNAAGGSAITTNGGAGVELFDNASVGLFTVTSDISIQPEQFNQDGILRILGGATVSTGGADLVNNSGGLILATGTIDVGAGTLVNDGSIQPGGTSNAGILTVLGNFSQSASGSLNIEVDDTGTVAGTDFDQLAVVSSSLPAVTLDGSLFVTLLNADPNPADVFVFLEVTGGGTVSGTFASEFLPPGFAPLSYGASFVEVGFSGLGFFFDNDSTDNLWNTAANWSTDTLPTPADDVSISGFDVTISGAADANTLSMAGGDTLTVGTGGTLSLASDSTLAGSLVIDGGSLAAAGTLDVGGTVDLLAGSLSSGGATTVAGLTTWGGNAGFTLAGLGLYNAAGGFDLDNTLDNATLTLDKTLIINASSNWRNSGVNPNTITGLGSITSNGSIDINNQNILTLGVAVTSNATVTRIGAGDLIFNGAFTNNGDLDLQAGNTIFNSTFVQSTGSTRLNGGDMTAALGAALNGGLFTGTGTLTGALLNSGGFVDPGGQSTIGELSINGDYTQLPGGTLVIEIASNGGGAPVPGVDNDRLFVNGDATLQGNLTLLDILGYTPINSDTFTVLSTTGTLSNSMLISDIGGASATPFGVSGSLNITLGFDSLFSFTGNGDGSTWNDPDNWNQGVPGIGDDASIGSIYNVTIAAVADANTLSLAGGGSLTVNANSTLTIASSATLDGTLNLAGGDLDISGASVTVNGAFNWSGGGTIFGSAGSVLNLAGTNTLATAVTRTINAVTVNLLGNTTYSAGSLQLDESLGVDAIVNNSGVFDFVGNVDISDNTAGGSPGFNNLDAGTLVKSGGGASTISLPLISNQGDVVLQSGTLDINLATWTLGAGDQFSGTGTYVGNVVNNGGVVRPGGQGNVGTLTILGDFTNSLGTLEVEIDGPTTHDVLAVTNSLGYGNVAGSVLDISLLNFIPTVGESHNVITCTALCDVTTPFGTVNQPGGVTHSVIPTAGTGGNLNLTVTSVSFFWDGGGDGSTWFDLNNWSLDVLPNAGTDVVLASGDNVIFDGGLATVASLTLNNVSSLNLASGTLTNAGLLTINGGATLAIGGGTLDNGGNTNSGGIFVMSSGVATFRGNSVFNGGYTHSGGVATFTGTAAFNGPNTHGGGTTNFDGASSFAGATLVSGGMLNFNSVGTMLNLNNTWSGGTISGAAGPNLVLGSSPGDTTLAIVGPATKTLDSITLDMNQNDINMSGSGNLELANGATIDNTGGRSFNHTGNGNVVGAGTLINTGGTINKGAGVGTIAVDLINSATSVINVSGGTLVVADQEASDQATYNVDATGVLAFSQNRNLDGALNLNGTLIAGPLSAPSGTTTLHLPSNLVYNGSILLNNANLDLASLSGSTLTMNAGSLLGGRGTVQGNVNNMAGVLVAGGNNSLGNLQLTGTYNQGPAASVVISILNNGVEIIPSVLSIDGVSQLNGGTLLVGYLDESLGATTTDFIPIQFRGGVSGQFAQSIDAGGIILSVEYGANALRVLGSALEIPESIIDDLLRFLRKSGNLRKLLASNRSEAEAIITELLNEAEESGSLVCN